MGEGWSDWYALDLLVRDGLKTDDAGAGEVDIGHYTDADPAHRCARRRSTARSASRPRARALPGRGGYTLGDFGKIAGGPEVHADGEIWAQTLWDLRGAVGSRRRAERWSPRACGCRRPSRRSSTCATRSWPPRRASRRRPRRDLGGVRRARDGLLRARRRTRGDIEPDRGLQPAAGARRARSGRTTGTVTSPRAACRSANVTVGLGEPHRRGTRSRTGSPRDRARTAATRSTRPPAPTASWRSRRPGYDRVARARLRRAGRRHARPGRRAAPRLGGRARAARGHRAGSRQHRRAVRLRARAADRPAQRERLVGLEPEQPARRPRRAVVQLPAAIDVSGVRARPDRTPAATTPARARASTGSRPRPTASTSRPRSRARSRAADRGRLNVVPADARRTCATSASRCCSRARRRQRLHRLLRARGVRRARRTSCRPARWPPAACG